MSRSRSAGIASSCGEVQAALAGLDGVEQAVVIAREDRPGDKRLVGYVTGAADPAGVRAALAERLPELHGAGRGGGGGGAAADGQRQTRHPRPAGTRIPGRRCGYRAPASPVEEILAGIYAQVLGLERVGVDDSFFDLGGDSILSMQVVARARAAGLVCRPRDVFVEQTVARLARVAGVADGAGGLVDEGIGPVVATPIMRWLHSMEGPVDAVQPDGGGAGPGGGDRGRCGGGVAGLAGSACDVAAACRRRRRRGVVVAVPEAGSVDAGGCLQHGGGVVG